MSTSFLYIFAIFFSCQCFLQTGGGGCQYLFQSHHGELFPPDESRVNLSLYFPSPPPLLSDWEKARGACCGRSAGAGCGAGRAAEGLPGVHSQLCQHRDAGMVPHTGGHGPTLAPKSCMWRYSLTPHQPRTGWVSGPAVLSSCIWAGF